MCNLLRFVVIVVVVVVITLLTSKMNFDFRVIFFLVYDIFGPLNMFYGKIALSFVYVMVGFIFEWSNLLSNFEHEDTFWTVFLSFFWFLEKFKGQYGNHKLWWRLALFWPVFRLSESNLRGVLNGILHFKKEKHKIHLHLSHWNQMMISKAFLWTALVCGSARSFKFIYHFYLNLWPSVLYRRKAIHHFCCCLSTKQKIKWTGTHFILWMTIYFEWVKSTYTNFIYHLILSYYYSSTNI